MLAPRWLLKRGHFLPIASWSTNLCECRVAEAVDWRKRHLEALREMETEERRWRGIEQILRRLVMRLCAVATGTDARLDKQLETLSAAARRDADEAQLKVLFDSLTGVVMAVEKSAATATMAIAATANAPAAALPAPAAASLPAAPER